MTSLITDARAIANRYLGDFLDLASSIPYVDNLKSLLDSLAEAETAALTARRNLLVLASGASATHKDFTDYETMRLNLFRAQLRLRREIVSRIPAQFQNQIPSPVALSPVSSSSTSTNLQGVNFGAAPLVAWAAGVLAVLVALGLLYLIAEQVAQSADTIAQVGVAWANSRQYETLTSRRLETYQACVSSGQTPQQCSALSIATIPTPQGVFRVGSSGNFWLVALPVALAATGVLGWYYWRRSKGQPFLPTVRV